MKDDLMRVIDARARLKGGRIAYEIPGINININVEVIAVVLAIPHRRFEVYAGFVSGGKVVSEKANTLMDAVVLAFILHDQIVRW